MKTISSYNFLYEIISFWDKIMKPVSRIHEVRYFYVKSPASSYIELRLLMYELAGKHPLTSLILSLRLRSQAPHVIVQGKPENRELSSPCQPVLFYI